MTEDICSKCGEPLSGAFLENAWKFRNPLCYKCFMRHKGNFRKQLKVLLEKEKNEKIQTNK